MPAYKDGKYVSVPCEKRVLDAIERAADAMDVSIAAAALTLIEDGIRQLTASIAPVVAAPAELTGSCEDSIVFLANVPNEWLIEEIARRMGDGVATVEYDSAVARAEAAEERRDAAEAQAEAADARYAQVRAAVLGAEA